MSHKTTKMKKSYILFLVLIIINFPIQAQIEASNEFKITGKVKIEKTITLSDLQKYPTTELSNINTSCSPRKEVKTKSVKVVLLKNILDSVAFQYEKSSMLGQYYFLFVASDGYKIVFSFNEIYNTETGNNLYIVTEMDGKKIEEMENRILLLTTKDIKGGSRNIKSLSKIVVCSAE